jgi:putative toxin-antitoxin system antitoxin component (TIGR02293 family)
MIDHIKAGGETKPLSDPFMSMLDARSDSMASTMLIREGLPSSFFGDLSVLVGLSPTALGRLLGVSDFRRRRWMKSGSLSPIESDYFFRQAVVLDAALGLYEGDNAAMRSWLIRPTLALGQKVPAEMLSTFVGLNLVEALIWQIEHGVAT